MEGRKQAGSRIPISSPILKRSGSLSFRNCPPIQEHQNGKKFTQLKLNRRHSLQSLNTASVFSSDKDDDGDSMASCSSTASVCSNLSHFAHNGTTYSGRSQRYVVHCSPHSTETDDYLTPTQRINRTIRRLRSLLKDAQDDLLEKDKEIVRLTKEVVELRLLKIDTGVYADSMGKELSPTAPSEPKDSGESASQTNLMFSSPRSRYSSTPPLSSPLSDSGHFEDVNSPKDISNILQAHSKHLKTIESLQKQYEDEIRELKEKHNDKVDSLLQRITDVNDRYYALRPQYDSCKENIIELTRENEELKKNIDPNLIFELKTLNEKLLEEKHTLTAEISELKHNYEVMEVNLFKYDELLIENNELKNKQIELLALINGESYKCETSNTKTALQDPQPPPSELSSYTIENCDMEVKTEDQIATNENMSHLIHEGNSKNSNANDYSVISDLLRKLMIKQDELDDIQAKYRRLLASRADGPKHDPEMTLQFLKSAFYYFLTDRENAPGHLSAIESILGFTDHEKINIERAFLWR